MAAGGRRRRRDSEDAPAGGIQAGGAETCSGVKDGGAGGFGCLDAADRFAGFV